MKKIKLIAGAACLSLALSSFAMLVQGDELAYDSAADPLISLSYINEVVIPGYEDAIGELEEKITSLETRLSAMGTLADAAAKDNAKLSKALEEAQAKNAILEDSLAALEKRIYALEEEKTGGYEVLYLKKGQKIMAEESCEIILRTGRAIVVSIVENGINDVTAGTELLNADTVPAYHNLLVPRADGRGIQIVSEDAYIMVRGAVSIVN